MKVDFIPQALESFTDEEKNELIRYNYLLLVYVMESLDCMSSGKGVMLSIPPDHPFIPYLEGREYLMAKLNKKSDQLAIEVN